jgi:hypothetical protein
VKKGKEILNMKKKMRSIWDMRKIKPPKKVVNKEDDVPKKKVVPFGTFVGDEHKSSRDHQIVGKNWVVDEFKEMKEKNKIVRR